MNELCMIIKDMVGSTNTSKYINTGIVFRVIHICWLGAAMHCTGKKGFRKYPCNIYGL